MREIIKIILVKIINLSPLPKMECYRADGIYEFSESSAHIRRRNPPFVTCARLNASSESEDQKTSFWNSEHLKRFLRPSPSHYLFVHILSNTIISYTIINTTNIKREP